MADELLSALIRGAVIGLVLEWTVFRPLDERRRKRDRVPPVREVIDTTATRKD